MEKDTTMFTGIKQLLAPPVFEDEEKTRLSRLLHFTTIICLTMLVLSLFTIPFTTDVLPLPLASAILGILFQLGVLFLLRRRLLRLASLLLASALWVVVTLVALAMGGIGGPVVGAYVIIILIASLLLGGRTGMGFAALSVVGALGILLAETSHVLPWKILPVKPVSAWITQATILGTAAVLLWQATRSLSDALERARRNERDLAESNRELQALRVSLEQEVEVRTMALSASEAELRALFAAMSDVILVLDAEGRYLRIAPTNPALLYKPPDYLIGKTLHQVFPAAQANVFLGWVRCALETRQPVNGEYSLQIGSQEFWFSAVVSSMLEDTVILVARDITERKRMEETLRESEARFREWFDDAPVGYHVLDIEGRIVNVNRTELEMLGYTVEEMVGRPAWEFVLEQDVARQSVTAKLAELFPPQPLERTYIRKDGSRMPALIQGRYLLNADGEIEGYRTTIQDITGRKRMEETLRQAYDEQEMRVRERTAQLAQANQILQAEIAERKQAEEALRESQSLYRSLVEVLPQSLCRKDLQGRFTFGNQRYCASMNKSLADIVGKTDWDLHPAGLADKYTQDDRRVIETGQTFETIEEHVPLGGEKIYVQTVKSPILDAEGTLLGVQVMFWDVTEHWRAEQEIKRLNRDLEHRVVERTAQLEAANRELHNEIVERKQTERTVRLAEQRYRDLFEEAPVMYVITRNQEGVPLIADCNQLFLSVLGYTRAEVVGQPLADFYTPASRDTLLEGGYQRALSNLLTAEERELVTRDGRVVMTLLRAVSETDAEGRVVGTRAMFTDITERKQAEEALRISEERFALAVQGSNDGLWDYDIQGKSLYWSPRLKELQGYAADELDVTFDSFDALIHPDDRGRTRAAIEAHLMDRVLYDVEYRSRTKSGEYRWFRARGQALWDEAGNPVRMVGFDSDITERKRAEEALRRSEEAHRALFEQSVDGIIIIADGRIARANQAFCALHGLPVERVVGMNPLDLIHPEERRSGAQRIEAIGSGEPVIEGHVYRALRADSSVIWAEVRSKQIEWEGKPAFQSIVRDITDRRRAEEALKRRAAQLALLSDVGKKISATLELESVLDKAAHLVQEGFGYHHVALFTLDRERGELVMRARVGEFVALFPLDHRIKLGQGLVGWVGSHGERLLANDVRAEPRYTNFYPDLIPTQSELCVPIRVGNETVGVLDVQSPQLDAFQKTDVMVLETLADQIAVAIENARLYEAVQRELAERKRAEEQLQHYSAELAQSNEELKRFTYTISHDLRAPLVNLKGFAGELASALEVVHSALHDILPQLDEEHRSAVTTALLADVPEALGFIDASVTRMDHYINALLKLSRLGRRDLVLERVDMEALTQATLETLAYQIEQRQARVTVRPLPAVVADRTALEQIMSNLLNNALIYLEPGRVGEIEVSGERNAEETLFHVRDNGRGIAQEDMDKVFAPFRRAGKQDVAGEGMGLAYVQTLVRRHEGRIWCESEPGIGTSFTFTISHQFTQGDPHD